MTDRDPLRLPISIKAALLDEGGRVCLLLNERDQWELPGGRLQAGESPSGCLVRELREELGVEVRPGRILAAWVFAAVPGKEALVVLYSAARVGAAPLRMSEEHRAIGWYLPSALEGLPMPGGYSEVLAEALTSDLDPPA